MFLEWTTYYPHVSDWPYGVYASNFDNNDDINRKICSRLEEILGPNNERWLHYPGTASTFYFKLKSDAAMFLLMFTGEHDQ